MTSVSSVPSPDKMVIPLATSTPVKHDLEFSSFSSSDNTSDHLSQELDSESSSLSQLLEGPQISLTESQLLPTDLQDSLSEGVKNPSTSIVPVSTPKIILYKLVFDNVDLSITPTDMRSDVQKQLAHYVQIYAVKDRVDFSHLSEAYPTPVHLDQISLDDVLPSSNDYKELMSNFTTLVSRIMTKHLNFFSSDSVCTHIPHKYQKEMATRSEVVSACILHLYIYVFKLLWST